MSKYSEAATTVRNQSYLVAALTELGYKPEVHADGAALVGYQRALADIHAVSSKILRGLT